LTAKIASRQHADLKAMSLRFYVEHVVLQLEACT